MKYFFTKNCLLLLALLFMGSTAMAQFTASGTVTDKNGESLIGVSVILKGTALGTVTDLDGSFTLEVPTDPATLEFSYTGFGSIEQEVSSSSSTINITLGESTTVLDEVVVTGLATSIKRSNLANSVASVPAKEISGIAVPTTTDAALYGKFKGVNISANSGAPGGGLSFKLRGLTSISGSSQPLLILDGVYIDNSSIPAGLNVVSAAAGGGSQSNQDNPSNRFADIDPYDIETIEVLKGPSAAAIYGSRASGGVVIITTKRGQAGKTKINLSQSLGWTQQLNKLGVREFTEDKVLNSNFASSIDAFRTAKNNGTLRNYEDELYGRHGLLSNTRLTVSGGNAKTQFFLGGSYKNENGIVSNTGFIKESARLNVDHKINDWLSFSGSSNYIHSSTDRGFFNNDNSGTTMGIAFSATPSFAQLLPDANGNFPTNPFAPSNFLETAAKITNNERVNRFIGGGTVTAQIWNNNNNSLKFLFRGGIDYFTLTTTALFPNSLQFESNGNGLNGVSVQGNTVNLNTNLSAFLVYSHYTNNGLTFRTQVGVTQENFDQNTILGEATNLIGSQTNLDQSGSRNISQNRLVQEDKGFFAQEEINWKDRIILTGGVRADKSSNNGDPNDITYYPKASAAINVNEFDFFHINNLSTLKLRMAYGQSGNFAAFGSKFSSFQSAIVGGSPGVEVSTTKGNPNVSPERQEEIEAGFDLGLFSNKILFDFTFYRRTVDDLLLNADVPTSSGFVRQVTNAAKLRNRGVELGLNAEVISTQYFNWSTRIGWWTNDAEVTKLLVPSFTTGGFADFLGQFRIKQGHSPTEIIGVGPAADQDEDGLVVFGDAEPDFQMTWMNTISWKRFDLTFLWHWKQGGENINLSNLLFDLNNTTHDFDKIDLDPNKAMGNGDFRLSQLGVNTAPYIEDASYLRLRELGVYYTLPSSVFKDIAKVKVGFSGTNLINIFDYNSYDPEVSNFGANGLSTGVEVLPFPSSKRFNFHLSVDF